MKNKIINETIQASAFPNIDEIAKDYSIMYSDHLPIFTQIPINDNPKNDLKALSYNVMGAGAENNLTRVQEDEKLASARYARIAKGVSTL